MTDQRTTRLVTKDEFNAHIKAWPKPLTPDTYMDHRLYHDFSDAEGWNAVVASCNMYSGEPTEFKIWSELP